MAKKGFKEIELYRARRRKVYIADYNHESPKSHKTIKIEMNLYISNQSIECAPNWIQDWASPMEKERGAAKLIKLNRYLEQMTMEFYSTDQTDNRSLLLTRCDVQNFALHKGPSGDIYLSFVVYTPANIQARDYLWDMKCSDCWVSFDFDQSQLPLGQETEGEQEVDDGENEDEEDEEDEDEEEDLNGPEHDEEFSTRPAAPATTTKKATSKPAVN